MIELMLQLFGGGGGKSGAGGGAGSTGTGKGGSHSNGRGSAGGTNNSSGGAPAKKTISVSEPVKTIDEKARYVIYNSAGKELKSDVSGASLKREVEDKKLRYNGTEDKWVVKSNNKRIIIRRRK